jgi:WhiB family redox-sensing transcriptional regulator
MSAPIRRSYAQFWASGWTVKGNGDRLRVAKRFGAVGASNGKGNEVSATAVMVDLWAGEWTSQARCTSQDPDALFVRGKAQHDAKAVCRTCPVLAQCLAEALDNRTEFGVWGGMTERERRALLRRRPDVSSWKSALREGMAAAARRG